MRRKCTASGVDAEGAWACDRDRVSHGLCKQHRRHADAGKPFTRIKTRPKGRPVERHVHGDMHCRIPEGHQRCNFCEQIKPLAEFCKNVSSPNGRNTKCRSCQDDFHLDRTYGLGASEWWRWKMVEQGWKCDCCKRDTPGRRMRWHFDHCHRTGAWRAILCQRCNTEIGVVEKWRYDDTRNRYLKTALGIALT